MRRAARTDANHAEVVAALIRVGCSVQSTAAIGCGFPVLIVFAPALGRLVLLEVKDGEKVRVYTETKEFAGRA